MSWQNVFMRITSDWLVIFMTKFACKTINRKREILDCILLVGSWGGHNYKNKYFRNVENTFDRQIYIYLTIRTTSSNYLTFTLTWNELWLELFWIPHEKPSREGQIERGTCRNVVGDMAKGDFFKAKVYFMIGIQKQDEGSQVSRRLRIE